MDPREQSDRLQDLLSTRTPPVAVTFRETAPAGVPRVERQEPAGCGYWRKAAEGDTAFYTEASDHFGCPIGAHTHGVPLPPQVAGELQGLVQTMVQLRYLRKEEIPSIPARKSPFGVAIYAPLAETPCDPDLVLVRGTPRQLMLLSEAAQAAGVAGEGPTLGRPTCSVIPLALETRTTASSFGCVGNRVYTGLGDDEAYLAIPGACLPQVLSHLAVIVEANRALETFHRGRLQSVSSR